MVGFWSYIMSKLALTSWFPKLIAATHVTGGSNNHICSGDRLVLQITATQKILHSGPHLGQNIPGLCVYKACHRHNREP
jgi:hypothetical protein